MELRITTLIENNPGDEKDLSYEHGLSLLIEADGKRILFDTGQSGDFIKNAKALNQSLLDLNAVIISHGHYDHSGGFEKLVTEAGMMIPQLIVGEEFFLPKYKNITDNQYKYNGNSFDEEYIRKHAIPLKKVKEDIYYITESIMVFHNFKRSTDFEKINDKFFIDNTKNKLELSYQHKSTFVPDEFTDEIVLGIYTEKGFVVIVGCSHVGIVNILRTIMERTKIPIYAVIGGTHLIGANEFRIQQTISSFNTMNLQYIAVSHCTGEDGMQAIRENFKEKFIYNNTGMVISF